MVSNNVHEKKFVIKICVYDIFMTLSSAIICFYNLLSTLFHDSEVWY